MERIPILKMGEFLLVTIQVDMHDRLALALQEDLTERIVQARAKGVLIDISALEMVDSFIGRMIADVSSISSILDAHTGYTRAMSAAPTLDDYPIILRGSKGPITERTPAALTALACRQGWTEACTATSSDFPASARMAHPSPTSP